MRLFFVFLFLVANLPLTAADWTSLGTSGVYTAGNIITQIIIENGATQRTQIENQTRRREAELAAETRRREIDGQVAVEIIRKPTPTASKTIVVTDKNTITVTTQTNQTSSAKF